MSSNLTVVTPITNMAGKLDLLESWVTESLGHGIDIRLIHDYRDEGTQRELEQLVKRCSSESLVLMSGKFGNPGSARNAGMVNMRSEWVCFWDSDDFPNVPNVISEINSTDSNVDVVIGRYLILDKMQGGKTVFPIPPKNLEEFAFDPGLWRILFRAKLMEGTNFPPLRMGEDQVFLSKLNLGSLKVQFSNQYFYSYIKGEPTQLTNNSEAISDLRKSYIELRSSNAKKSSLDLGITSVMMTRMCLTLIKKGNLGMKIKSILALFFAIKRMGPKIAYVFFRRIWKAD